MHALKTVTLDRGAYTWCTVNLHGANITSWRIRNVEQLFVSTEARYNDIVMIRGGIQILFPQYGSWKLGPQHGFARLVHWSIEQPPRTLPGGDVEAIFTLDDDPYTCSMWSNRFHLSYRIKLMEREIRLSMNITNTDKNLFLYTHMVFHPYFRVPDVREVKIAGLLECDFHDKLISESGAGDIPVLKIDKHMDRVYMNTKKSTHILANVTNNKKIKIDKFNCPDTVIWNSWSPQVNIFSDLLPEDYLKMLVVACGHCMKHARIAPGETINCKMTLKLKD